MSAICKICHQPESGKGVHLLLTPQGKLVHPRCYNREERVVSQILSRRLEGVNRFVIPNNSLLGRVARLNLSGKK